MSGPIHRPGALNLGYPDLHIPATVTYLVTDAYYVTVSKLPRQIKHARIGVLSLVAPADDVPCAEDWPPGLVSLSVVVLDTKKLKVEHLPASLRLIELCLDLDGKHGGVAEWQMANRMALRRRGIKFRAGTRGFEVLSDAELKQIENMTAEK